MNERGFIAVSRSLLEHPVVGAQKKPYCETVAWLWLLMEAAWKPRRVRVTNGRAVEVITLERGQLSHSQSFMAKAWGWSQKRVRTFLGRLEKEGQIALQTGGLQTIITICNYDEYQLPGFRLDGQSDGQTDGQRARKGREEEQGNKGTKKKKLSPSPEPEGFAEFYAVYPRKEARQAAARAYANVVPAQIGADELLERTTRFARQWAGRPKEEHKFCPLPASWLNGRRFLDDAVVGSSSQAKDGTADRCPLRTCDTFTDHDWQEALDLYRGGQIWPEKHWGPPPGQPGCRVPARLLVSPAADQANGELSNVTNKEGTNAA